MAHECPDCGQTCYCHGDIDDCIFDNSEEQAVCDHCPLDDDGEPTNEEKEEYRADCIYDQERDRKLEEELNGH